MCVCCIDEACAACHWRSGLDQVVSALHHLPRWTHYLRLIPARKKGNTAVCFGVVYGTCEAVVVPPHREFAGIRFWRNLLTAPMGQLILHYVRHTCSQHLVYYRQSVGRVKRTEWEE